MHCECETKSQHGIFNNLVFNDFFLIQQGNTVQMKEGSWLDNKISARLNLNQVSYDHRSYERNLSNCVKKPEKVRTSTGFEPVTSRYRCDALTNWAMKPLTLGAGHLWVLMRCEVIYEMLHIPNCGFWNQVSYDHRSYERNLSNCVKKPGKVRTSTGFEPVTSRHQSDAPDWATKL